MTRQHTATPNEVERAIADGRPELARLLAQYRERILAQFDHLDLGPLSALRVALASAVVRRGQVEPRFDVTIGPDGRAVFELRATDA